MLSYKHIYHAGNHADVIKHLTWLCVIQKLNEKPKSYTLYDTHAGGGLYDLNSSQAQKNTEFQSGIGSIMQSDTSSPLTNLYIATLDNYSQNNTYPGSPLLAANLIREQDTLHVMELHPNEFQDLQKNVSSAPFDGQIKAHARNGLEGLVALTPPSPNRGAVLIDPPYELASEYDDVKAHVQKCLKRWNNAIVCVWYPLLSKRAGVKSGKSEKLVGQLSQLVTSCWKAELWVDSPQNDTGMYGSGMCVLNPPWQVDVQVSQAMQEWTSTCNDDIKFELSWLVES